MKRLTVAAAAFAAGMLTIVAHSQAESDRYLARSAASAPAKADKPEKAGTKETADNAERKTAAAELKSKAGTKSKALRTKAATEPGVDKVKTAAIAPRKRPELKAKARKSVVGVVETVETTIGTKVAGATSYTTLVSHYASAYGVPTSLAHAVIRVESNYRPNARGGAGEIGLMQIKPSTARMMGYSGGAKGLFNPETNIKYGMKYLAMAHQLSGGKTCGTILRYNAGHGARRMNPVSAAYCSKVKGLL